MINALSAGMAPLSGGKVSSPELSSSSLFAGVATKFLESQDNYTTTKPKAFLNWILFDEQFNMVASSSGFEPVPEELVYSNTTAPKVYNHVKTYLPVHKNGYLYIYVSNEIQGLDLFFDNLQVTHIAGPVVEETHYYPFGLTMAGISSKALGKLDYKRGFNGNEIQSKEFNDGSGLEFYDFNARTYDQQIGRFIQLDPLTDEGGQEKLSPYHFSYNNPIRYNDPDGKCPSCIIGGIIGGVVDYGTQVAGNLIEGKSLSDALMDVNLTQIGVSAIAGAVSGGFSAFAPKGAIGVVAKEVVSVAIDATESGVQQLNQSGTISMKQMVIDVSANKVGGSLAKNVKVNSSDAIKTTEKQLNRAERVAVGDPTSRDRTATVKKLENKLENQNSANQVVSQGTAGVASNTIKAAGSVVQGNNSLSASVVNYNAIDITAVRKPIPTVLQ